MAGMKAWAVAWEHRTFPLPRLRLLLLPTAEGDASFEGDLQVALCLPPTTNYLLLCPTSPAWNERSSRRARRFDIPGFSRG